MSLRDNVWLARGVQKLCAAAKPESLATRTNCHRMVKLPDTQRSVGGKLEQIVGLTLARGPTDATGTVALPRKSLMIRAPKEPGKFSCYFERFLVA
jgi:hypothetical protein